MNTRIYAAFVIANLVVILSLAVVLNLLGQTLQIVQEPQTISNYIPDREPPQGWLSAGKELSELIVKVNDTNNKISIILDKDIRPTVQITNDTIHIVNGIVNRLNEQGYVDIRIMLPKTSVPTPPTPPVPAKLIW